MSLGERGYLADFWICKLGVALAAAALIGSVCWMSGSFTRVATRADLGLIADELERALGEIDGMHGEVDFVCRLPSIGQPFKVSISGTCSGGIQLIRIGVGDQVERVVMVKGKVNGGEFELHHHSPTAVHLTKLEQIALELV